MRGEAADAGGSNDGQRTRRRDRPGVGLALAALLVASALGPGWGAAPARSQMTAGESLCEQPVDVLLLFDTTGSMGDVLDEAKAGASDIVNRVQAEAPDTRFGVANYRDYPDSYSYPGYSAQYGFTGDYPWQHDLAFTSDTAAIQSAVDGLSLGSGADTPESVSRALHETRDLGWRSDAVKVVVLFADAPPHDLDFAGQNTGGDPGVDAAAQTADDLDFETEVDQLAGDGVQTIVVDSGSLLGSPAYFRHAAEETGGAYEELSSAFRDQVTDLILEQIPKPTFDARSIAATGEVSVPANPHVEVNPVRVDEANVSTNRTLAAADLDPVDGSLELVRDAAHTRLRPGELTARANVTIDHAELFGGLVEVRNLHATVEAQTTRAGASAQIVEAQLGSLVVAGEQRETDVDEDTLVPFPGGSLTLKATRTADPGETGAEALADLVRVAVDRPEARGEATVGRVYAGTSCRDDLGGPLETRDNDAGSGSDAGDSPDQATSLSAPALVQGRTVNRSDQVDAYAVHVEPGEKIEAVVSPSTRAEATLFPPARSPEIGAALPDVDLYLREPGSFQIRESSTLPLSAPDRVELNVDRAGDWILEVRRATDVPGNYTLGATVTPIPLLPQNDDLSGDDAPDACAGALPVDDGLHPGVLEGPDRRDFYEVPADRGDALGAALKPTEDADGANFDLHLYDERCRLLSSSRLGSGLVPKGTPEFATLAPVPASGDYVLEVRRVNGIGNYYLTTRVQDPQPTVGPLDAESGGDAGSGPGQAEPISNPFVGQGSFPNGDEADWYAVDLDAGQNATVTLKPSELSNLDLALVAPDGTEHAASRLPSSAPETIQTTIDETGTWHVAVDRLSGGGDYLLSLGAAD